MSIITASSKEIDTMHAQMEEVIKIDPRKTYIQFAKMLHMSSQLLYLTLHHRHPLSRDIYNLWTENYQKIMLSIKKYKDLSDDYLVNYINERVNNLAVLARDTNMTYATIYRAVKLKRRKNLLSIYDYLTDYNSEVELKTDSVNYAQKFKVISNYLELKQIEKFFNLNKTKLNSITRGKVVEDNNFKFRTLPKIEQLFDAISYSKILLKKYTLIEVIDILNITQFKIDKINEFFFKNAVAFKKSRLDSKQEQQWLILALADTNRQNFLRKAKSIIKKGAY